MPTATRSWKRPGRIPPSLQGGTAPSCWHLPFRLFSFRTVRDCISIVLRHQICDNSVQQPQKTSTLYVFTHFILFWLFLWRQIRVLSTFKDLFHYHFLVNAFWFLPPSAIMINLTSIFFLWHFISMSLKHFHIPLFTFLSCLSAHLIPGIESALLQYSLHNYGSMATNAGIGPFFAESHIVSVTNLLNIWILI